MLIIGAGPIGLTTACALVHHGVRFRIIERAHGISGASKGHNCVARSQELLNAIGVRDLLAAKSYVAPFTQFMLQGKPFARVDTLGSQSPYAGVLFSNQGVMEQVLTDWLTERGVLIETGHEARDIVATNDDVTVGIIAVDEEGKAEGPVTSVRCRYLIGADGAKGTVRKAADLDFRAEPLPGRALRQIDGKLRWRRPTTPDTARFFLFENGFAGVLPVWEDQHRFFVLEDEGAMPERDPTREEMVERAREITGDATFDLTEPSWFSYGKFEHGVAPGYGRGRIFLVGDAGHRTLPIGGQGMNAGFLDATGIAWRLAMTLSGAAGPAVLESYDGERHGAHAALGDQQVRGFEQLLHRGEIVDGVLGRVVGLLPGIGSYVFGGSDLEQLEVAYPDSALSDDHFSRWNPKRVGSVRAGGRAPDAKIQADGKATTLFDNIYNPDGRSWGWRLLLIDGQDRASHPDLRDAAKSVSAFEWVRPMLLTGDPTSDPDATLPIAHDLDGLAHEAFGLMGRAALMLIRPDGHIAFRGAADQGEALLAYLTKIAGQ
ncbi:FAD-dependent monooxygenase [Sphingomonas sp. PP-CC-3G-468]|uniref:FAD-dependent monooxygenase n=1 Tax=Sphingomonas sp. PP-CC-3G-468 TaxID=2135656 RepID=UPI001A9E3F34|nr:FAD-dependent monooxygenase [Sphingomonas sp. PP-CC-3G-468]